MKRKKFIQNEKGFTLIEIIAVIIIMGILAAVAVPKFFSMQDDAVKASLNGALSESAARFNHAFSKFILENQTAPNDVSGCLNTAPLLGTSALTGEDIGDFVVKWEKSGTDLVITVVSSDTIGEAAIAASGQRAKTISGVNWGLAACP
ncbi:type II secretion system protein [Thermodesulfobacteriota bacterium]